MAINMRPAQLQQPSSTRTQLHSQRICLQEEMFWGLAPTRANGIASHQPQAPARPAAPPATPAPRAAAAPAPHLTAPHTPPPSTRPAQAAGSQEPEDVDSVKLPPAFEVRLLVTHAA